ncbi:hypothetical protein U1Q18_044734 [Sarracenia purpurea var. burkii]
MSWAIIRFFSDLRCMKNQEKCEDQLPALKSMLRAHAALTLDDHLLYLRSSFASCHRCSKVRTAVHAAYPDQAAFNQSGHSPIKCARCGWIFPSYRLDGHLSKAKAKIISRFPKSQVRARCLAVQRAQSILTYDGATKMSAVNLPESTRAELRVELRSLA